METNPLVVQFVRTALQWVWAGLAAIGAEAVINPDQFEAWLTAIVAGVVLAGLQWLERKFPAIGKLFGFAKTPSY